MNLKWLPNAICLVRMVLVAPLVATLIHGQYHAALALALVAGGSDLLDGLLARSFNWRSRLGSLLDPAADKLLIVSVFITLTCIGLVPAALTLIVVLRDVVIVLGVMAYQMAVEPVRGEPSAISKLNTVSQLAFAVLIVIHAAFAWPPRIWLLVVGAAVVCTSITSGLRYVLHWGRRAWLVRAARIS